MCFFHPHCHDSCLSLSHTHTLQPPFFRHRSAEDDFQLAVQSLGVGAADEGVPEEEGGEGHDNPHDANTHAGNENAEPEGDGAAGSGATKETASPPEHPLQKAITSFDMALGELNQLVHLVDLARAGEFMVLKRVTPSEEDQARAMPDQSVSILLVHLTFVRVHLSGEQTAHPSFGSTVVVQKEIGLRVA